jgi:hypothetical protein
LILAIWSPSCGLARDRPQAPRPPQRYARSCPGAAYSRLFLHWFKFVFCFIRWETMRTPELHRACLPRPPFTRGSERRRRPSRRCHSAIHKRTSMRPWIVLDSTLLLNPASIRLEAAVNVWRIPCG